MVLVVPCVPLKYVIYYHFGFIVFANVEQVYIYLMITINVYIKSEEYVKL